MTKWKLSIPPLERLPLWLRILIGIVTILIVLLILHFVGAEVESEESEQIYQGVPLDAHLLQVDKEALELAYKDHLKLLFSVWLKDDISAVHRINNGLRNARRAYAHAAAQIEKRERLQR